MGKIVLIFIFTFCTMVSAQIRGTSQVGSLKLKKDAKENLPAKITLIEPSVKNGEELTVESSGLVIRGKVENNNTVKAVRVNNQEVTLNEDNSFYYESKLQPGLNSFLIKPVSESNSSSSFVFYIRSQPKNSGSAIVLLQPVPDKNNEVRLKEKSLLVKVKIQDIKDLKEVLINNKKANSIKKTEFYTNLSLNDGYNSVSIKAVDKKGRITETDFKVIVDSDKEGPKIKILEPVVSRGIRIVRKTETLLVKGKAEDKSGVYEVTINGIRTDLQPDGSFSLNMYLAMGDNLLVVKALDNNLNAAIDTFRVTRKLEDLLVAGNSTDL